MDLIAWNVIFFLVAAFDVKLNTKQKTNWQTKQNQKTAQKKQSKTIKHKTKQKNNWMWNGT